MEYHLQYLGPPKSEYVDWPEGSVSVYRITGDQIADRVVFSEIVKPERGPAYYEGPVIARHSWCGYVGLFRSLDEAVIAIKADRESQKQMDATQAARRRR
jgi:hypothetical protein